MNAKMEASGSSNPIEDKALSNFLARSAANTKNVGNIKAGASLKRRGDEAGLSSREEAEVEPVMTSSHGDFAATLDNFTGTLGEGSTFDRRGRSIIFGDVDEQKNKSVLDIEHDNGVKNDIKGSNPFAGLGDKS